MAGAPSVLIDSFRARYGKEPEVFRAPGRVNLIGEHTDYNLGFVLPIAIDFATWWRLRPTMRAACASIRRTWTTPASGPSRRFRNLRPQHDWTDYVIGIARQMPHLGPLDALIYSTVPVGAGLSSSAALEVSTALAFGSDLRGIELAKQARRAENDFVGMPCGIMDQYASVCGREGAAIRIDCRSLDSEVGRTARRRTRSSP